MNDARSSPRANNDGVVGCSDPSNLGVWAEHGPLRPGRNSLLVGCSNSGALSKVGSVAADVDLAWPTMMMVQGISSEHQRHRNEMVTKIFSDKDLVDESGLSPPPDRTDLLTAVHRGREERVVGHDCSCCKVV